MNCPKCSRQLGCSCQLRYSPTDKSVVIGCSGCLQGKNVPAVAQQPKRNWPNKPLTISAPIKQAPKVPNPHMKTPVVSRAYWTKHK